MAPIARKLAHLAAKRPGIWIAWSVLLVIGARALATHIARSTHHRNEIAEAIGSIGFVYGAPQPDHSGSRVLYLQTTDAGLGVFASDTITGRKQALFEDRTIHYPDVHNRVSPFSPDDSLFAYTLESRSTAGYIAICQADSGKEVARIPAPQWNILDMVWLTPGRLVCMGRPAWQRTARDIDHPRVIEAHSDGKWKVRQINLTITNGSCPSAISPGTFAWVDDDGLRTFNIASNRMTTLFKPKGRSISEYAHSLPGFLVTCREKNGFSLWNLNQKTNGSDQFKRLAGDGDIHNAQWLDDRGGYAYLNHNQLVVNVGGETGKPARAMVDSFTACPQTGKLYCLGTVAGEPWSGVWSYDPASQTFTNVVPYSEAASPFAGRADPSSAIVHFDRKRSLKYYLYQPAHFDRHKKYPLVIGDTPFLTHTFQNSVHGPSWAEALAVCGSYVVIIDRRSWFGDIEEWPKNVMIVYHELTPDPAIDTSRVYLFGTSAETKYLSSLLLEQPALWKGAILFNPDALPDLSTIDSHQRLPRLLISAGADEGESDRFNRFQQDADRYGVNVEILQHQGSGHYLISIASVLERTRNMVDFVFND